MTAMSARNIELLYRTSQTSFLLSNNSLCLLVSEESIFFLISANQKQELHMSTMFLSNRDEMRKSYRGHLHRRFL
jgi:hypothetical protein